MPSFTFIATAHAAAWEGLDPVFVDVESDTHTLDPECVRAAITERTAAIMGVHLWGRCCNVDALQAIADQAGVPVTRIGVVDAEPGLRVIDADARPLQIAARGFDHFAP